MPGRATLRDVFAVAEFRVVWSAQLLSLAGDQLARVALSSLVYDRTGSALLAATTYAATVAPTVAGGVVLACLADRYPRRRVMIACDILRAVLVTVMASPGMNSALLVALIAGVTLCEAPFASARASIYPDILAGDRYVLGTAVTLTASQFAQFGGFAVGGAVVAFLGVPAALLADAATFAISAALIRLGVAARTPARSAAGSPEPGRAARKSASIFAGARLVFGTPSLRSPLLLACVGAFFTVPQALALPLAHAAGGGAAAAGLILAAGAAGSGAGMIGFNRFVPAGVRSRLVKPLAAACCTVLVTVAARPGLAVMLAILFVSGVFACYQPVVNAAFVSAAPPQQRSQAFGVAIAAIALSQSSAMIAAGGAASGVPVTAVVGVSGAIGAVLTLCSIVRGAR